MSWQEWGARLVGAGRVGQIKRPELKKSCWAFLRFKNEEKSDLAWLVSVADRHVAAIHTASANVRCVVAIAYAKAIQIAEPESVAEHKVKSDRSRMSTNIWIANFQCSFFVLSYVLI